MLPGLSITDHVIQRLKDRVTALSGRVEGAASLVQLMQENQLPQHSPAANVISSGLAGGATTTGAGTFVQAVDETVSVFLTFRNVQGKGTRALDHFDAVREDVIAALCGWAPGDTVGVFRLVRGQVVRMAAGTLIYQIDFAVGDQLRIIET
jgi:hypothetical protein